MRLPVEDKNWLVKFVRQDYKVAQKRKELDPKKYPNKVHTGPKGSGDVYFS